MEQTAAPRTLDMRERLGGSHAAEMAEIRAGKKQQLRAGVKLRAEVVAGGALFDDPAFPHRGRQRSLCACVWLMCMCVRCAIGRISTAARRSAFLYIYIYIEQLGFNRFLSVV